MFWSGDKLKARLPQLVRDENRSQQNIKIDCASIVLTVGPEVYSTPQSISDKQYGNKKKIFTDSDNSFEIPPGQFSFILTDEYVSVPKDAIAFISFKASFKFQGLINVSGFHVDPGWDGRLIFSVFNAGPKPVTLSRNDPFALIWYADLDRESSNDFSKYKTGENTQIPNKIINGIAGEIFSPFKLRSEVKDLEKLILKTKSDVKFILSSALLVLLLGLGAFALRFYIIDFFEKNAPVVESVKIPKKPDAPS